MAITDATKTTDFSGFVPAEQAGAIFEKAARISAVIITVMALAKICVNK